jgi:hypothetical protein
MGTIANPLAGLIDGLLKGHELATQLHRQQQEDIAFKTNQALHNQQMSIQDIMNRQMLEQSARPVSPMGTVENPAVEGGASPLSGMIPGLPNDPGLPAYHRKADKSRTVKYGDQQYELKTPEEQQKEHLDLQVSGNNRLEEAKTQAENQRSAAIRANTLKLEGGGTPAVGLASVGVADGTPLTRQETIALTEAAQKIRAGNQVKLAPGETVQELPAPGAASGEPGTPKVIATGGAPLPTGDMERVWLPAFALNHGLTADALKKPENAALMMQGVQEYAQRTKDPAAQDMLRQMHAATLALTQERLAQLQGQRSSEPKPIETGTREFKIAQDLAYGKLTMQQFRSLYAFSRDTNKKLDIYDKAAELNPNFNPAQFEMGFNFAKNPKIQQQLASMDNVEKGVNDLLKFSDAAGRSGITTLNKIVIPGGIALGGKKYSNFHAAQIGFADELSGALGFGGATDMSRQMGLDLTNPNLSPEAFRSSVQDVVVPFIQRKRKAFLDQMGVYGQPGMNPAAPAAAPAESSKPPLSSFEKK